VCYTRVNRMRTSPVLSILTIGFLPLAVSFAAPGDGAGRESLPSNAANAATAARSSSGDRSVSPAQPFVLRKVGYLATVGPVPLRFGAPTPDCNLRTPPRVPAQNKRTELGDTAEAMARTEAIETYRSLHGGLVPVPPGHASGGIPPGGPSNPFIEQGGISSGGNEVMEFFQQPPPEPDVQKRQNRFLFDPIFQAAPAPAPGNPPQSRATFRQN